MNRIADALLVQIDRFACIRTVNCADAELDSCPAIDLTDDALAERVCYSSEIVERVSFNDVSAGDGVAHDLG